MTLVSGWGRYPTVETEIVTPRTLEAARRLTAEGEGVVARGNGRAYGDAAIGVSRTIAMKALNPHSPDDALSNGALHADSDIGISTLFWIERGGDGKPGG